MNYQPREFWNDRLSRDFDLRGTGETGMSLEYNRACYELRREVLTRALAAARVDPAARRVLDAGCGTGFFTAYYLERGAQVTGLDIAPASIERLRERHPEARFVLSDVSEAELDEQYDLVNAMDVLYHITDERRWQSAVTNLARAVAPGGTLLLTDTFSELRAQASHNRMRPLSAYTPLLRAEGVLPLSLHPTHVLLNRELGPARFLNRVPGMLLAADRALLAFGFGMDPAVSKLLVAKRGR